MDEEGFDNWTDLFSPEVGDYSNPERPTIGAWIPQAHRQTR